MYLWIKAFHIISVIAWMAALLYLPRLYVYHAAAEKGSGRDATFQLMEKRLLKIIMTPAMVASFLFGTWLVFLDLSLLSEGWFHTKLVLILLMAALHGKFAAMRKHFAAGKNAHSDKYYRIWNEAPAVLMVVIVILAVVKPF